MPNDLDHEPQLRLEALNQAVGASSGLGLSTAEQIVDTAYTFEKYLKHGRGKVGRSDDERRRVGRA